MNSLRKTLIISIAASILALCIALFAWYMFLDRTNTAKTLDSVYATYTPGGSGGSTGASETGDPKIAPEGIAPEDVRIGTGKKNTEVSSQALASDPVGGGADIVGESVRFIDRAKGYIYESNIYTGKTERISNIILPGAFDIDFLSSDTAIAQTLNEDGTTTAYMLTFTKEETTKTALPLSLVGLDVHKESGTIYALARTDTGGSALISLTLPYDTSTSPTFMWQSPLSDWTLSVISQYHVTLTQKASTDVPGYSYMFNARTKELTKIAGDLPGLVTSTSPSGIFTLITTNDTRGQRSYIQNNRTLTTVPLARITYGTKCAWEKDEQDERAEEAALICGFPKFTPLSELPDVWYQGAFAFDDVLGRVALDSGEITEIETKIEKPVDITNPTLTRSNTALVFMDKTTGALWTVRNIK